MKFNLSTVLCTLSIVFLAWIILSWIDVLAHQDIIGGTQNALNFFALISK